MPNGWKKGHLYGIKKNARFGGGSKTAAHARHRRKRILRAYRAAKANELDWVDFCRHYARRRRNTPPRHVFRVGPEYAPRIHCPKRVYRSRRRRRRRYYALNNDVPPIKLRGHIKSRRRTFRIETANKHKYRMHYEICDKMTYEDYNKHQYWMHYDICDKMTYEDYMRSIEFDPESYTTLRHSEASRRLVRYREASRQERLKLARRVGRQYVNLLYQLWRDWKIVSLSPVRTRRHWTNWTVTIRAHRDGRHITLRFHSAPDDVYVLDVWNLLTNQIRVLLFDPHNADQDQKDYLCLPHVFPHNRELILLMTVTCGHTIKRPWSRGVNSDGWSSALLRASTALRKDRTFVSRLSTYVACHGIAPKRELSFADRSLRDDPTFIMMLIRRYGYYSELVFVVATRRALLRVKRHFSIWTLALCQQRRFLRWLLSTTTPLPPALCRVWTVVARYIDGYLCS